MNVGDRVGVKQNQIGDLAGLDGPAAIKLSHGLSGVARGGLQSGQGR